MTRLEGAAITKIDGIFMRAIAIIGTTPTGMSCRSTDHDQRRQCSTPLHAALERICRTSRRDQRIRSCLRFHRDAVADRDSAEHRGIEPACLIGGVARWREY